MGRWHESGPGVVRLPSGVLVRGRGLRDPFPEGPAPEFGVYLLGSEPPSSGWDSQWVRWPDFRLPSDPRMFERALQRALTRAGEERVEFACGGGRGRTGTALACLAVLDGLPNRDAVDYVRTRYSPKAVETPWQKRFVRRFRPSR